MLLVRYAQLRIRGWWALALAGRGRGAPDEPEKDRVIADALRAAPPPPGTRLPRQPEG